MKEHLLIELDHDLLGQLLEKAKSEKTNISLYISSILTRFFKSGGVIDFNSYCVRPIDQKLDDYLKEIEKSEILKALNHTQSKSAAADHLGITFRSFRYRCSEHKIDTADN